eukprot:4524363-Alexandrium_andersonii.AAC.1
MSASLVGSEMCIRDSQQGEVRPVAIQEVVLGAHAEYVAAGGAAVRAVTCLLYTSDAADDM